MKKPEKFNNNKNAIPYMFAYLQNSHSIKRLFYYYESLILNYNG